MPERPDRGSHLSVARPRGQTAPAAGDRGDLLVVAETPLTTFLLASCHLWVDGRGLVDERDNLVASLVHLADPVGQQAADSAGPARRIRTLLHELGDAARGIRARRCLVEYS